MKPSSETLGPLVGARKCRIGGVKIGIEMQERGASGDAVFPGQFQAGTEKILCIILSNRGKAGPHFVSYILTRILHEGKFARHICLTSPSRFCSRRNVQGRISYVQFVMRPMRDGTQSIEYHTAVVNKPSFKCSKRYSRKCHFLVMIICCKRSFNGLNYNDVITKQYNQFGYFVDWLI